MMKMPRGLVSHLNPQLLMRPQLRPAKFHITLGRPTVRLREWEWAQGIEEVALWEVGEATWCKSTLLSDLSLGCSLNKL